MTYLTGLQHQLFEHFSYNQVKFTHRHNTGSAAIGNFFQKDAKLEIQKRSFSRLGTLVWYNIAPALRDKPKTVNRKTIRNSIFNLLLAGG